MKNLKRIYILGTSGSGKTFVGKILSRKLDIPFYDSDDVMFIKKFTKTRSKEKRKLMLSKIAKKSKWIIDGRSSDWSRDPMKKSDLIIWLQPNIFIRSYRILKRYYSRKNNSKYQEDIKSLFKLLKYSWSYKLNGRESGFIKTKKFIEENKLNPVIIKSNNKLNKFLKEIK